MTRLTLFKLPLSLLLGRLKKGGLKTTRVMRHILIFLDGIDICSMLIEVHPHGQIVVSNRLLIELIHHHNNYRKKPFVEINFFIRVNSG